MTEVIIEVHMSNAILAAVKGAISRGMHDILIDYADLVIDMVCGNIYDDIEKGFAIGARAMALRGIAKNLDAHIYQIDIGDRYDHERFYFVGVESEIVAQLNKIEELEVKL